MPTLRKYKPSSSKSGYYIQAHVGAAHPITLQVTQLASTILEKTGYEPDDSVPTKLVWAMYDLGLLFTKNSLDPEVVKDVTIGDIFNDLNLDNRLSATEKKRLTSYIEKYEGPEEETLTQLKKELETTTAEFQEGKKNSSTITPKENIPQTEDEAISQMYHMCSTVSEFRKKKRTVDKKFLLRSFQSFLSHPFVDRAKSEVPGNLIRYHLNHPDREQSFWLEDHRSIGFHSGDQTADFVLEVSEASETTRAVIVENEVAEFNEADGGEYSLEQLESDLDWILPQSLVEMDETLTNEYTEYNGLKLDPIRAVGRVSEEDLRIVEVDRISNNGNPVVESDGDPCILDRGEPGEQYLAEKREGNIWRAISKVIV